MLNNEQQKKSIYKCIFLTIFLDIAGFSLIFPLIPQLINYYTQHDPENFLLKIFWNLSDFLANILGSPQDKTHETVLFGCLIGSIYSAVQFIAAPIWGKLSDVHGRKQILQFTLLGTVLSYLLWFFSGSFTLLVVARLIGGLSSGNISVATTVVADVTDTKSRSSGMAIVGIAFAIGFVVGPALGGILSQWDLSAYFSSNSNIGINPFSSPALLAFILSILNLILVFKNLPETIQFKDESSKIYRTNNLLKIFQIHPNKKINLINMSYFLFITLFSGMEFTLTFLTVERLSFAPVHNGFLFVYIGLLIALVQGGFVRRRAHVLGEKRVALMGLITIIPGLFILSLAHSLGLVLFGLFFLSFGSAMVIPTMTSLISLNALESEQGHVLGIFRSLGSLGRIFGPLIVSMIYWRWGSYSAYIFGTVAMIIPFIVLRKLVNQK